MFDFCMFDSGFDGTLIMSEMEDVLGPGFP